MVGAALVIHFPFLLFTPPSHLPQVTLKFCLHSLGQDAIFLIGGPTKQTKPLPLLLHSGDIVVMSGDSRLSYHAIPKILATVIPDCLSKQALEDGIGRGHCICDRGIGTMPSLVPRPSLVMGMRPVADNQSTTELELEIVQNSSLAKELTADCGRCQDFLETWKCFEMYLSVSRVNINVREVGKK